MGRVRVFYGHEGIVPPTGLRPRSAAEPAPDAESEVDVIETIPGTEDGAPVELVGEAVEDGEGISSAEIVNVDGSPIPVDEDGVPVPESAADALPDESWTKGDLLAFAEENGIDMTGATKTKPAALARILESTKEA